MSEATPCIQSLREFRSALRRDGNLVGAYWANRCIMRLQRLLGDGGDRLAQDELDSARMPLDPPIR